jgi:hypothetical protein
MDLPIFKYHPDPIATGSIEPSDIRCICCGEQRGYTYVGPVFSIEELSEYICRWCIADGSAHDKFDAEFSDAAGVAGYSEAIVLPNTVIEEVAFRTPGFLGWQQEHWLACCATQRRFSVERAARSLSGSGPTLCLPFRNSAASLVRAGRITSVRSTKMEAPLHTFSGACTVADNSVTRIAIGCSYCFNAAFLQRSRHTPLISLAASSRNGR